MASDQRTLGMDVFTALHNMTVISSSHNNTSENVCCSIESSDSDISTKNLAVPVVMFFLGVVGNVTALVILTVKPSKDIKTTAFYNLVKALACMDLFGIVASSPVTIIVYIGGGVLQTGGLPLCHYFSIILIMAGNGTLYTVLVMAAERFIVTKYPFKYNQVVTPMAVNCSIAVVWGMSLLIALLPVMGVGTNTAPWPGTWCFFDYRGTSFLGKSFSYFYAIVGLLAVTTTFLLNLTVIHHLWHMRRNRLIKSSLYSKEEHAPQQGSTGLDSEIRLVIFLMTIIIVFTVCYTPLMISDLQHVWYHTLVGDLSVQVRILINQTYNSNSVLTPGGKEDSIDLWALRLACVNQILDPWVYIICRVTCCKGPQKRRFLEI